MALIGKDEFVKAWLIYLKDGAAVLSRRHYESWWEIQDEFGDRFKSNRAITDADCGAQVIRYMSADFSMGKAPFSVGLFCSTLAKALSILSTKSL